MLKVSGWMVLARSGRTGLRVWGLDVKGLDTKGGSPSISVRGGRRDRGEGSKVEKGKRLNSMM